MVVLSAAEREEAEECWVEMGRTNAACSSMTWVRSPRWRRAPLQAVPDRLLGRHSAADHYRPPRARRTRVAGRRASCRHRSRCWLAMGRAAAAVHQQAGPLSHLPSVRVARGLRRFECSCQGTCMILRGRPAARTARCTAEGWPHSPHPGCQSCPRLCSSVSGRACGREEHTKRTANGQPALEVRPDAAEQPRSAAQRAVSLRFERSQTLLT
jgi:hypothetical protein